MIEISYDTESSELPSADIVERMSEAASIACAEHGIKDAEVSLSFTSPQEIRELNSKHRGVGEVTDVLSFPQFAVGDVDISVALPVMLGDIVICSERAMEQANEYGHGAEREFVYLFVHGLLHLLGYDHEDDDERAEMRTVEEDVLRQLDIQKK